VVPIETNHERFKRLAEARVTKTIKDIRLIANLSNRNNYAYTPTDIEKIFKALEKELKVAKARFDGGRDGDDIRFSL
jgi:hypothetical protein